MRKRIFIVTLALVLAGGLAVAQDQEAESTRPDGEKKSAVEQLKDRMRQAIRLPRSAEDAREAGVDQEKVREVLKTGRDNGVSADEMKVILDTENSGLREGGNPENFGASVQAMKASGLRGRELADAIHAEQAARGMKKQERHRVRTHTEGDAQGKAAGQGQGGKGQSGKGSGQGQSQGSGKGQGAGQGGSQGETQEQGSGSQGGKGKGQGQGGGRS